MFFRKSTLDKMKILSLHFH